MSFVLEKRGSRPVYVAEPGSQHSYTPSLRLARKFTTFPEARANMCPENEIVRPI